MMKKKSNSVWTVRADLNGLLSPGTYSTSGLCKRTLSVTVRGMTHHLVAYFSIHDLAANALISPSMDPLLAGVTPRAELVSQGYGTPVEQDDLYDLLALLG